MRTTAAHGAARIETVETEALQRKFGEGLHAVIAGFQGLGPDNRVTTLGRGGSDTSAVAVAAALNAERCDIYTDVDGVYTTEPRIESSARRIEKIAGASCAGRQGAADPLRRIGDALQNAAGRAFKLRRPG